MCEYRFVYICWIAPILLSITFNLFGISRGKLTDVKVKPKFLSVYETWSTHSGGCQDLSNNFSKEHAATFCALSYRRK